MQATIQQTAAYGLYRAAVFASDGAECEGWGLTPQQAEYRARIKAQNHSPAPAGSP